MANIDRFKAHFTLQNFKRDSFRHRGMFGEASSYQLLGPIR